MVSGDEHDLPLFRVLEIDRTRDSGLGLKNEPVSVSMGEV
jgi:hypothetical protein